MSDAFDFSGLWWVLVVAGVLLGGALFVKAIARRLTVLGILKAADEIEKILAVVADPTPHDLVPVEPTAHADSVRALVEQASGTLAGLGFTPLGDLEDRTVSRVLAPLRQVTRHLVSGDGTVQAGILGRAAELGAQLGSAPAFFGVELSSGLTDGTFIETRAATDAPELDMPAHVRLERHPADTPLPELLALHQQRLQAALDEARGRDPTADVVRVGDLEALIQRIHRFHTRIADARAGIPAGITPPELARMAPTEPGITDLLHHELKTRTEAKAAARSGGASST
jgi:hypothetical protein